MATKKETALSKRITELWAADYNQCRTGKAFFGCREDFAWHAEAVLDGSVEDNQLAAKLGDVERGTDVEKAYRDDDFSVQGAFLSADDYAHHIADVAAGRVEDPHAERLVKLGQLERERDEINAQRERLAREGVVPTSEVGSVRRPKTLLAR